MTKPQTSGALAFAAEPSGDLGEGSQNTAGPERPPQTVDSAPEQAVDLVLDPWRLRVVGVPSLVAAVSTVMVPPCTVSDAGPSVNWTIRVDRDELDQRPEDVNALLADRPMLASPHGGPRLAVAGTGNGLLRLLGLYRPGSAAALLEVDRVQRLTRVSVPYDDSSRRWPDWLARLFFSSRMLDGGWRMLHASAVTVNGTAVLFVAGSRGGKSTLAHRACDELGARFMADDLVMIGMGGIVAGWPTRVGVPEELAASSGGVEQERRVGGVLRRRVLFTAGEHRAIVDWAPPAQLGAVVHVVPAPEEETSQPLRAVALDPAEAEAVLAGAASVPGRRLYSTDLLGVTGGPPPGQITWPTPSWADMLADVPAVRLTVPHLRDLPHAPVWETLAELLQVAAQ
ncbi:hypothetical protein AB0F88_16955 [Streptosporangium sp. NPDC023963]|uniref:hypothetical protein n=1 Tax=Streptosporangium sp. NPDC023963 TaxID=3155608 RepID=UPI0034206A75